MKTYRGIPPHRVDVDDENGIHGLRHLVRHSPTGFSWGYHGSGPSDLARSLLADALGDDALCAGCEGTGRRAPEGDLIPNEGDTTIRCWDCHGSGASAIVEVNYQAFKRDVVAGWPMDEPWEITQAEILDWLRRQRIQTPEVAG